MKLYLAGPMRGIAEQNAAAFHEAARRLRFADHIVISPVEHEIEEGVDLTDIWTVTAESLVWDLAQVGGADTDAIVLLPGWERSAGTLLERRLAQIVSKPIYYYAEHGDSFVLKQESVGDPRFHQLLTEIGTLHDRKQADYGSNVDPFANVRASEDFGIPGWVGGVMRLNDKVHRLKQFAQKGVLANESAEDSMMDIAVYSLIALVLYREPTEQA